VKRPSRRLRKTNASRKYSFRPLANYRVEAPERRSAGAPDEVVDSSMGWLCSSMMVVEVMTGSFQKWESHRYLPRRGCIPKPRVAQRTLGGGAAESDRISYPERVECATLCNPFGVNQIRLSYPGCASRRWAMEYNPFGVELEFPRSIPQGAPKRRPWALEYNPFGVNQIPCIPTQVRRRISSFFSPASLP